MTDKWGGQCINLRAAPHLAPTLAGWLHEEWLQQCSDHGHRVDAAYRARLNQLRSHAEIGPIPCSFIALQNDIPIGCVSLTRLPVKQAAFARGLWLSNLYVVPSLRRRGVAAALLHSAEQEARDIGEQSLYLFSQSSVGYYLARGWRSVTPSGVEDLGGQKVSVLKKSLVVP